MLAVSLSLSVGGLAELRPSGQPSAQPPAGQQQTITGPEPGPSGLGQAAAGEGDDSKPEGARATGAHRGEWEPL